MTAMLSLALLGLIVERKLRDWARESFVGSTLKQGIRIAQLYYTDDGRTGVSKDCRLTFRPGRAT